MFKETTHKKSGRLLRVISTAVLFSTIFLSATVAHGQKKNKFKYDIKLKPQPSTFTLQIADTSNNGKCKIIFLLTDLNKNDSIAFVSIKLKNNRADTSAMTNIYGLASLILPADTFNIIVASIPHTVIRANNFVLTPNTRIIFHGLLGKSNAFTRGHIYSNRKLTDKEIENIIDDLSNDKQNELIENKTCIVGWEI